MKLPKKNNLFTWIVFVLFGMYQFPELLRYHQMEGQKIPQNHYFDLVTSEPVSFPPSERALVVFWASWCTPCVIEMNRLKSSVESGKIPRKRVFAINPFEEVNTIKLYLKSNPYPFYFIQSPQISQMLKVDRTPTIVWTKDGLITSMNSGISLIGIWKAELLLD